MLLSYAIFMHIFYFILFFKYESPAISLIHFKDNNIIL